MFEVALNYAELLKLIWLFSLSSCCSKIVCSITCLGHYSWRGRDHLHLVRRYGPAHQTDHQHSSEYEYSFTQYILFDQIQILECLQMLS